MVTLGALNLASHKKGYSRNFVLIYVYVLAVFTKLNWRTQSLLTVSDVSVHFGGIVALDSVSFSVEGGEIVGLIGPNGAGKTTLFNCLSRLYSLNKGSIRFENRSLLDVPRLQL